MAGYEDVNDAERLSEDPGKKTAPKKEKPQLGGSKEGGWVYTMSRPEAKMEIPVKKLRLADEIMAEDIQSITERLRQVVSHPEFLKVLREIEQAPSPERLTVAQQLATPTALAQRGIPIPQDFRVTTRIFEQPSAATIQAVTLSEEGQPTPPPAELATGPITICASVGFIVCASVGTTITPAPDPHVIVSGSQSH